MKILFLDVDGVLNMISSGGLYALNRNRLRNLETVVNETGCKIVLSSTWRKDFVALKKLKNRLNYRGLSILDCTTTEYFKERQIRGDEIQKWLDSHEWDSYAIVDDDGDMLESQLPFFVQTDSEQGLTVDKAKQLIEILNEHNQRNL